MNYKSLILAAMAGLTLASCVKDVESPEVGEIRDAKLEQIQSATDLNKAQAAAIAKLADAEAALMAAQTEAEQAQAAYLKAQTELVKAQTEGQNIANEKALAELEAALLEAQLRKEKAQAELERLAIETEKALIEAQQELLNAKRSYAYSKNNYLAALANDYVNAVMALNSAQSYLITLKGNLASAEQDLITVNESREKQILNKNRELAREEAYLAYLKENLNLNEEERASKIDELLKKSEELYIPYMEKLDIAKDLSDERQKGRNSLQGANISSILQRFSATTPNYSFSASYSNVNNIHSYEYSDIDGKYQSIVFAEGANSTVPKYLINGKHKIEYFEYSVPTITNAEAAKTVAEVGKAKIAKTHEANVKTYSDKIAVNELNIKNLTAEIAKFDAQMAEYNEELEKLNDAKDEASAKKAEAYQEFYSYINELNGEKARTLVAKNDADNKVTTIESAITSLKGSITSLKGDIATNEETVAITSKEVADKMPDLKKALEAAQKADAEAKAAVEKKEAEVAELKKAMDEAYAAYWQKHLEDLAGKVEDATEVTKLYDAYTEAKTKYEAADGELTSLKGEASTAAGALATAEGAVKNLNDSMATAEKTLADNKKALAENEAKLAKAEAELEAAKAVAEAAAAAYEAASADFAEDEKYVALKKAYDDASMTAGDIQEKIDSINESIRTIKAKSFTFNYFTAPGTSEDRNWNYFNLTSTLTSQIGDKETNEGALASYEKDFADFNERIDNAVSNIEWRIANFNNEEVVAKAVEQNELEIKTAEAYLAANIAKEEYNKVIAEISALEAAPEADANIKEAETRIENLKKEIEEWLNEIKTEEQAVAKIKADIATQEKLIEAYTIAADEAKAALDAALAEYAEDVE